MGSISELHCSCGAAQLVSNKNEHPGTHALQAEIWSHAYWNCLINDHSYQASHQRGCDCLISDEVQISSETFEGLWFSELSEQKMA
ncbi:hypothetical protein B9Z55_020333 [Caenorhabditis nigoni]|uniref:Uncharacterized protein n=1 Tax=Caenorhabditis nigoni TaxID=1611254 RepID=A0A2G5TMC9_9PELO|nr:hypothetical protein B9Z55_020333 [Caenorhabditis nigoni]